MKICSYCGKRYPDTVDVCAVDQKPLEVWGPKPKPVGICPQCNTPDDFTRVVELDSKHAGIVILLGGLPALMFRNAGRPYPVRCNKCDARFYIRRRMGRISQVIFWLLITPPIVLLIFAFIVAIRGVLGYD